MKGRLLLAALRAKARITSISTSLCGLPTHVLQWSTCSLMRRANLCSTASEVERTILLELHVVEVVGGAVHLDVVDAHHCFLGGGVVKSMCAAL